MNETELYRDTVLNEIVDDGAVRRFAKAATPKSKRAFGRVLKPAAIVLGVLVALFGITMTIPAARAEIFRWFVPTSARDYLMQEPEEREPNPELEALIVPAEQSETRVEVQSVAEEDIFAQIAKALETVELGDTMYDGESLYIRMRVNGIALLAEVEAMTGGNLTKTVIPPEGTPAYFEDYHTPEEFLSGEQTFWADADMRTTFTFADGTCVYGDRFAIADADVLPLLDSLSRDDLDHGFYSTSEQLQAINALELAYLKDRTVNALSATSMMDRSIEPDRMLIDEFRAHADSNGRVAVTVGLKVIQDLGEDTMTVLVATLGEVTVDLDAYKSLQKTELQPDGSQAVFAPEQALRTFCRWERDENGVPRAVYQNEEIDLDGLTLEPLDGAYIDARGIQNLRIRVTPPKGWSQEMLDHLIAMFLSFEVEINGERLGYVNDVRAQVRENGTVTVTVGCISGIPLDDLKEVKTVKLIPTLSYVCCLRVYEGNDHYDLNTPYTETELVPGVAYRQDQNCGGTWVGERVDYPQYAITFTAE